MLRICALFLLFASSSVYAGGYGGGGGGYQQKAYTEYDCGGTCGGGCTDSNSCGGSYQSQAYTDCSSGSCESPRYSSDGGRHHSSSSSGYHKTVTTVTKEERKNDLKIIVHPQPEKLIHRTTTYVQPAAPIIRHSAAYVQSPTIVTTKRKSSRYYEHTPDVVYPETSGCGESICGGSKIVKIIKKTTYGGGDDCIKCGYSGDYVSHHEPVITRKVTRIITRPEVVRVVKTKTYVDQPSYGGGYYSNGGGGVDDIGYGGDRGGYGSASSGSKSYAFASASAGAGAGSGSRIGGYNSGSQWK